MEHILVDHLQGHLPRICLETDSAMSVGKRWRSRVHGTGLREKGFLEQFLDELLPLLDLLAQIPEAEQTVFRLDAVVAMESQEAVTSSFRASWISRCRAK